MTQKLIKDVYRGIEYVRLSSLPEDQKMGFESWLSGDQVIKIMMNNSKILPDCVQYHIYEKWYEEIFPTLAAEKVNVNGNSSLEDLSIQG